MTTTPTQQSTQERDRDLTEYLYTVLRVLPIDVGGNEAQTAALVNSKREAAQRLEDVEINFQFGFEYKATNEPGRKAELKAALLKSPDYIAARKEVMNYENAIEIQQAESTGKRREFQAAIALAELHAARINMITRIQRAAEVK
jgi:hypothetical protein